MDGWTTIEPLYDRLPTFVAYARKFVLDSTEAEDVTHDAFMKLKTAVEAGSIKKPEAYLRRTIRNAAVDRNENYDESRDTEPHLARLTEARQLDTAGEALFNVSFNTALDRLAHEQRSMFVLCELRGLSRREASRELGISTTEGQRLYESARRSLAKELA